MLIPLPHINIMNDESIPLHHPQTNVNPTSLDGRNIHNGKIRNTLPDCNQITVVSSNNSDNAGQKRHGSNSYNYFTSNLAKRRIATNNKNNIENPSGTFLDPGGINNYKIINNGMQNTPLASPKLATTRNSNIATPQQSFILAENINTSFLINNMLPSNLDTASTEALDESMIRSTNLSQNGIKESRLRILAKGDSSIEYQASNIPSPDNTEPQLIRSNKDIPNYQGIVRQYSNNDNDNNNDNNNNTYSGNASPNNNNTNSDSNSISGYTNNNMSSGNPNPNFNSNIGNNHDNNGEKNNNRSNNNEVPSVSVPSKKSSQALVQKLQDIYKAIIKQEMELQERCSQLTTSQTTELKSLWAIYRVNSDLMNNYVTFITTALYPTQSKSDQLIGQEIVEIYKIERRLWVYGTITFLDVLKNFSNFMDPEVCSQFITHVFVSISSMLSDIPQKYCIPWLQKLGDLSRMAIALYPSPFIDWKLSAERWYMAAMEHTFGHGKLYYHIATVQQNTLEAFVNLGKSVFCQNIFVPTQQYLQLVIDNIYQRAYAERTGPSNNRNNQFLIDYLKHSEVMLLPDFQVSPDLSKVVLVYFLEKFGIDYSNNSNNIFTSNQMFIQNNDQLKYYYRHSAAFAESHILQLVGYGNPKTSFALLFELPKFLKDRKDTKEKRGPKSPVGIESNSATTLSSTVIDELLAVTDLSVFSTPEEFFANIDSLALPNFMPTSMDIWNYSLKYNNSTAIKCSMIVLKKFLHGPFLVALPHILPWTYFLISIALQLEKYGNEGMNMFWVEYVKRIFPWNSIVNFLNVLMAYMVDNCWESLPINNLCKEYSSMGFDKLLAHFNENEELPEVWKCRGSLWFDVIAEKGDKNKTTTQGGVEVKDYSILDFPTDGIEFDEEDEIGIRFWKRACRIIYLFKGMSEKFPGFGGLYMSYTSPVVNRRGDLVCDELKRFSFKLAQNEDEMMSDQLVETFEEIQKVNRDVHATPLTGMVENESIFDYVGYKRVHPDYYSFDKNGDFISASYYNTWSINQDSNYNSSSSNNIDPMNEKELFNNCFHPSYDTIEEFWSKEIYANDAEPMNLHEDTYFILDATSWLRHFAHVYKIATNSVLKFAICLTTFQELRFLRKSKDENVVEAATRAIITLRQLYSEKKLLPLRFTGNIATHIEEHLEFEEQITWRSHVDEFVIEAVLKTEDKRRENNSQFGVVLVTDDINMKSKAKERDIKTFSTRYVFAISNYIRINEKTTQLAIN